MFLLVPAYPGCPGSKAVKRSLLLLLLLHGFPGLFSVISGHICFLLLVFFLFLHFLVVDSVQ